MKSYSEQRKQRTLAQQTKYLLGGLLLILFLYFLGSIYMLGKVRNQALQEMNQLSKLYTNELDSRFLRIGRRIYSTVMDKNKSDSTFWKYVDMMSDESYKAYAMGKLREEFLSSLWEYGSDYHMFLYLREKNGFYPLSITDEGNYHISQDLKETIILQVGELDHTAYAVKKKWNVVSSGGETYICKVAQNREVFLGCYVNVKSILQPFTKLGVGEGGYACLVDESGRSVGMVTEKGVVSGQNIVIGKNDYEINQELFRAPFSIIIKVSWGSILNLLTGSILVLSIIAAAFIFAGVFLLLHLKHNILKPLKMFTENLEKYDQGDMIFAITENGLLELEQIDDKFRNMLHQIRRLKITIYEQELEKQKIEMDYLKMQIRPHFYLNCLNFIYSMIDFGKYEHARDMSRITADYLSYIFRNTNEKVIITAETEHCENYLKILLLRYPESFDYYVEVHEEVKKACILPFLIQVFVENAAKHALTLEEKILISITVYPEDRKDGKYVNIYISDTGCGFPEKILAMLQKQQDISEGGKHLGILNCMKRFHYYYGDKGELNFDNSPLGGAIVDIHIPYETEKEK